MGLDVINLPDAPRHHAGNAHLAGEHAHAPLVPVRQPGLSEWCPRSSAPTPGCTLAAIDSAFERGAKSFNAPLGEPVGRDRPVCCAIASLGTRGTASRITAHFRTRLPARVRDSNGRSPKLRKTTVLAAFRGGACQEL